MAGNTGNGATGNGTTGIATTTAVEAVPGDFIETEFARLGWLRYRIVNTARMLDDRDCFFLDDHINAGGHRRRAAAIAGEISRREREDPILTRL